MGPRPCCSPAPEVGVVKCRIRRVKTGGGMVTKGSILYVLELEKDEGDETARNQFLLAVRDFLAHFPPFWLF